MSLRQSTSPPIGSRWKLNSFSKENAHIVLPDLSNTAKTTKNANEKKTKTKRTSSISSLMNFIPSNGQTVIEEHPPKEKSTYCFRRTMSQSGIQPQLSTTQMKFKSIIKSQTPMASINNINTALKLDQPTDKFDKMLEIYEILASLKQCKANYGDTSSSMFPSKNDVKRSLRALELLNEKGSPYSELMELVVKILRMATYSTKALLHQYESSLSNIYNPDLHRVWINGKADKTPYFTLCVMLFEELKARDRVSVDVKNNYESKITELKQKLEDANKLMEREVEKINKEVIKKIKSDYEEKIKELNETIEKQANEYSKLFSLYENESKEYQQILRKLEAESDELHLANVKISGLQEELTLKDQKHIDTVNKLSSMHEHSKNFKGTLDKVLMQLFTIKQMVDHLKAQNCQLEAERDSLKLKTSVGIDDLTPRPDYAALQAQYKVDFNVKLDNSKKNNGKAWLSTKSMFETLLNKHIELQKAKKIPEVDTKRMFLLTPQQANRGAKRLSANNSKNISPRELTAVQTRSNVSRIGPIEPIDELMGPQIKICESSRGGQFLITQDPSEVVNQPQSNDQEARSVASRKNSIESDAPEGIKIKINLAEDLEKARESHEFNIIGNKIVAATQNLSEEVIEAKKAIESMDKEVY